MEEKFGGLFERQIETYLTRAFDTEVVTVLGARQIIGGASRETWEVHIELDRGRGAPTERELIFRIDPDLSLLPSNRKVEFAVYRAFWKVPQVPVPEVLFIEDDPSALGRPFFVMSKVKGSADNVALLSAEFAEARPVLGRQMMEILGWVASVDYREIGLDKVFNVPSPEDVWAVELDYWEKVLADHDLGPSPVTEAAIRHLRRHPPSKPERLCVVHGDYRIGNFLFTDRIEAILDWEMAHLGDPHEDLAWAFARPWRSEAEPHLTGGLLDRESALKCWEETSGLEADPDVLRWWELFIHVKSMGIWATGVCTQTFRSTFFNWMIADKQEMWMLEDMGRAP